MTRKLLILLSTASLLAGLAVPVLYVVERNRADWFNTQRTDPSAGTWRAWTLVAGRSGFYASRQWFHFDKPEQADVYGRRVGQTFPNGHMTTGPQRNPFARGGSFWNRAGFGLRFDVPIRGTAEGGYWYTFDRLHVPYWALSALLLVFGVPAARWLVTRFRRDRRLRAGHCPACGYDLRATPGRCPECGKETAAA